MEIFVVIEYGRYKNDEGTYVAHSDDAYHIASDAYENEVHAEMKLKQLILPALQKWAEEDDYFYITCLIEEANWINKPQQKEIYSLFKDVDSANKDRNWYELRVNFDDMTEARAVRLHEILVEAGYPLFAVLEKKLKLVL